MLQRNFNEVGCVMLCPKASNSAKAIVGAPGHCQNCLHYILTNLTDMVAVKDTGQTFNHSSVSEICVFDFRVSYVIKNSKSWASCGGVVAYRPKVTSFNRIAARNPAGLPSPDEF